ncbi:unnamed protein product [Linum tenue]|uniref:Uncharacterized protein n=1 Tax=Linum tenue TaxID=586396 RepID=A0AAV0LW16_9ROSI|nr:unnamed protein product [Linum tenue]
MLYIYFATELVSLRACSVNQCTSRASNLSHLVSTVPMALLEQHKIE